MFLIEILLGALKCVAIDNDTGRIAGDLMRQFGRSHNVALSDALIAAAAIQCSAQLWTRNRKHFPSKGSDSTIRSRFTDASGAVKYCLGTAPLVSVSDLGKTYRSGDADLVVFRGLTLEVTAGEQVAVIGESGSGKSTLLHLISGLDRPTSGSINYRGRDITALADRDLSEFRNREIGYVWQQHHLLPEFTAEENVAMPLLVRGEARISAFRKARAALEEVGLAARADHRAGELSGGEQQRIAIARALVTEPSVLLADEPTGNLDERTGLMIFDLLSTARQRRNLTSVLVTHNLQFARRADRVLKLEAGSLHHV